MKESIIKSIQKFLNQPFKYAALTLFLDKQKDFLLQPNILEKTEECEYNALWDTIIYLEGLFKYAKRTEMTIAIDDLSVLLIFDTNYKERKAHLLISSTP